MLTLKPLEISRIKPFHAGSIQTTERVLDGSAQIPARQGESALGRSQSRLACRASIIGASGQRGAARRRFAITPLQDQAP
jgi:hypothetical protein